MYIEVVLHNFETKYNSNSFQTSKLAYGIQGYFTIVNNFTKRVNKKIKNGFTF